MLVSVHYGRNHTRGLKALVTQLGGELGEKQSRHSVVDTSSIGSLDEPSRQTKYDRLRRTDRRTAIEGEDVGDFDDLEERTGYASSASASQGVIAARAMQ